MGKYSWNLPGNSFRKIPWVTPQNCKIWKTFPGYPLSHRPFFGNSFRDLPIWVNWKNLIIFRSVTYKHLHCNFQSQLYPLVWHRNSEHCRIGFLFSSHHRKSDCKLTRKPMLKISENLINFILRGDFVIQPNPDVLVITCSMLHALEFTLSVFFGMIHAAWILLEWFIIPLCFKSVTYSYSFDWFAEFLHIVSRQTHNHLDCSIWFLARAHLQFSPRFQ